MYADELRVPLFDCGLTVLAALAFCGCRCLRLDSFDASALVTTAEAHAFDADEDDAPMSDASSSPLSSVPASSFGVAVLRSAGSRVAVDTSLLLSAQHTVEGAAALPPRLQFQVDHWYQVIGDVMYTNEVRRRRRRRRVTESSHPCCPCLVSQSPFLCLFFFFPVFPSSTPLVCTFSLASAASWTINSTSISTKRA